jgi:hypothetical protein
MAEATWRRVQRASSPLSSTAVRAAEELPWFAALPAEQRSYVGLVLHTGLDAFAQWLREPEQPLPVGPEVFAAAPKELTRVVNLKQTVQLIRVAVEVVEQAVPRLAAPGDEPLLREAVLRYSREIAFAAADVYAAAAEARGAWDARVEAGGRRRARARPRRGADALRVGSLGWNRVDWVVALATPSPPDLDAAALRATARYRGLSLLTGEAAPALVLVLGGSGDTGPAVGHLVDALPPAPVVVGPVVPELAQSGPRCRRPSPGWPPWPPGRRRRGRSRRTSCWPSGRCSARAPRAAVCWRRSTDRWRPRAATCWGRRRRTSRAAARWRGPPERCSCTPTPSGTA